MIYLFNFIYICCIIDINRNGFPSPDCQTLFTLHDSVGSREALGKTKPLHWVTEEALGPSETYGLRG